MGKSFDSLCFFVILLAAAPHFSRGGGCCERIAPNGTKVTCDNVLECIMAGEEDAGNLTHVALTKICHFGLNATQSRVAFQKDVIISSSVSINLTFPPVPIEISFRSNITFSGITIAVNGTGSSTVSISSSETESSASFSECTVISGVRMVFKTLVHVAVKNTRFDLSGEHPTMLEIEKGSLEFVGQSNEIKCVLDCSNATIKVNICRDSTISDVGLYGGGLAPTFDFSPCEQAVENVPTLRIEGVRFTGKVATTQDSAWMIVRGDVVKGPAVILGDNDYAGLADEAQTQIGRVFRFIGIITRSDLVESNFVLSTNYSGSAPSGWRDEDYLATEVCNFDDVQFLPIRGNVEMRQHYMCHSCCYVENYEARREGRNIADCLTHVDGEDMTTVHVVRECPFGRHESPVSFVEIAKADSFTGDIVEITLEEGDYSFVNDQYNHHMVFKNIHLRKGGANRDGVAKILLGSVRNPVVNVKIIGCLVDADVVVNLRHNSNFTATNTTFNQGSQESVLSFAANAATLSATVADCTFDDMESNHEMITGYSCGHVEIKNTDLVKRGVCNKAAINLSPCASNDGNEPATVKLEKLHFRGEIENRYDAAWIKVQGNHNGPVVTLKEENLTNITGSNWAVPRVYQFWVRVSKADLNTRPIGFSVTREPRTGEVSAQTEGDVPAATWQIEEKLATVVYAEIDRRPYRIDKILPIGNGSLNEIQTFNVGAFKAGAVCCYATMNSSAHEYASGESIAECLGDDQQWEVTVTKNCPLGEVGIISGDAKIKKDKFSKERILLIKLVEGQDVVMRVYPFRRSFHHPPEDRYDGIKFQDANGTLRGKPLE